LDWAIWVLAEATFFAERNGVDLSVFRDVVDAGSMASKVLSIKLAKLDGKDSSVQASISDVLMNTRLISDAAREGGIASPLLNFCCDLFARTNGGRRQQKTGPRIARLL